MAAFQHRVSVAAIVIACLGCSRTPSLYEYPPFTRMPGNDKVALVPIIAVGVVKHSSLLGKPHDSRWNDGSLMQLVRLDVKLENIIQGDTAPGDTEIFFYRDLRATEGPPRLGMSG